MVSAKKIKEIPSRTLIRKANATFSAKLGELYGTKICIITFPKELTAITKRLDLGSRRQGTVILEVHQAFLQEYQKYLHWIKIPELGIQGQIMRQDRIEKAHDMIQNDAVPFFLRNPIPSEEKLFLDKVYKAQ